MKRFVLILVLCLGLSLGLTLILASASNSGSRKPVSHDLRIRRGMAAAARIPEVTAGQTATLLPDGRWLLIGGEGEHGPDGAAEIRDLKNGAAMRLSSGLQRARAWHSATTLPDGNVLVLGGMDARGQLVETAELFNATTQSFEPFSLRGATRRAYHTATLLMNGQLLIAGGLSDSENAARTLELLDLQTRSVVALPVKLSGQRRQHRASLLANGNVLFSGGIGEDGAALDSGEVFETENQRLSWAANNEGQVEVSALFLAASAPKDGEMSVPREGRLALRFSKPVRVETVNAGTVTLSGPDGGVAVKVIPAESGMLAFVTPQRALQEGGMYTLSLDRITDGEGRALPPTSIGFMTVGSETHEHVPHSSRHPSAKDGIGTTDSQGLNEDNLKPGEQPDSRWRSMPPLQADKDVTALAGQVLKLNGQPLPNVTIQIEETAVRTDSTGRFLLSNIPAGHQEMLVNGETASRPGKLYATCENGVDITVGKTNMLPYTIWLPVVDTEHATPIPVPTDREVVATNPLMPGLEMHIPAGVRLRTHNGDYLTRMALTPVPLDRTPIPLPPGTNFYFTPQAHDAVVETVDGRPSAGIRIIYPNVNHLPPGTQVNLFDYNTEKGWYIYGKGTVTPDGKQVAPNPGVGLQRLTCNNSMSNPYAPGTAPAPGNGTSDGDPVDLGSGLFVQNNTDLFVPDTIPIVLTRTYRQNDTEIRAFGIGATHNYEIYLELGFWDSLNLILPDGGRVHYDLNPSTGVYENSSTPTRFYKSTITRTFTSPVDYFDLKLLDGTVYRFFSKVVGGGSMYHVYQTGLDSIQDRWGNKLTMLRDDSLRLTKILSSNGRWVEFTYDSSARITQARDSLGRTVNYTYNAVNELWKVTDVSNGVTEYTYDGSHRMLTLKNPRQIVYLTNEYDPFTGRVTKQTQPDGTIYQFAYTTDANSKVVQTDVTDPRNHIRRATFNADGYTLTDTFALGLPEEQKYTYERQPGSNKILSVTDQLNRKTAYTYDALGNVLSATRMAETSEAVTSSLTYEPAFNQLATVTDALNHTTTYGYDAKGNLTSITDPINHQAVFTYNSAGQPLTVTDALNHSIQLAYDAGDLVTATDPLGRSVTTYKDGAGRPLRITNALGQVMRYEYDKSNHVTKVTDPLQGVTATAYDPDGNLQSVTDARNNVTSYTYDNMERVATRRDPLLHDDVYEYQNGLLHQVTDRKGQVTTFSYDALDRLKQITYQDSSTTTYTYDAGNRVTQVSDSVSGTIIYGYDNLNRLTSKQTPQGTIGYTYDAAGRLSTTTVAGQPQVVYTYDDANRLTQVQQGAAVVTIGYDNANRRTSLLLPNGVETDYGYDAASQLTSLTYKRGATVLGNLTYTYDAGGRRTSMGGSLARSIAPQTLASASYNAANQQESFGAQSLTYDLNGNLLSDGTRTYNWNARNQLSSITGPNLTASFQYDATGKRISKSVNNVTTGYLYDGANIVQEQQSSTPSVNLLTGGLDEVFTRTDSTGTYNPLRDGLGSTLSLMDSNGTEQTQYSYDAFGQSVSTGAQSSNSAQYTGRENDGTGLQYNRHRYYSPSLQRFISQDPIGMTGGINLYAYTANNPISFSDPFGTDSGDGGIWFLGPAAQVCAGFGDTVGAASGPIAALFPGGNPVAWLRSFTPGGAAVVPSSGGYRIGQAGGIAWSVGMGGAAGLETGTASATSAVVASEGEETLQILDGVRRAKAAQVLGNDTIPAKIFNSEGNLIGEENVAIESLRSPKDAIEVGRQVDMDRWKRTFELTKSGSTPPPIEVTPGGAGIKISDVGFRAGP